MQQKNHLNDQEFLGLDSSNNRKDKYKIVTFIRFFKRLPLPPPKIDVDWINLLVKVSHAEINLRTYITGKIR